MRDAVLQEAVKAGEAAFVVFDERFGASGIEVADAPRQAVGRDAVDDAEVDGFGAAALLACYFAKRYAEDLRGDGRVDVLLGAEGFDEVFIFAEVREQAQLDL